MRLVSGLSCIYAKAKTADISGSPQITYLDVSTASDWLKQIPHAARPITKKLKKHWG